MKYVWAGVFARLTGEYEGDGKNDKEATVEADTKRCPGQSGLSQAEKNTQKRE